MLALAFIINIENHRKGSKIQNAKEHFKLEFLDRKKLDQINFSQLTMDRELKLSVEERFKLRKLRAEKVCEANQWTGLDQYLVEEGVRRRPNILYVDKYKMLYCVIPKVGCTNWKRVLLYLNGDLDEEKTKAVENGERLKIS